MNEFYDKSEISALIIKAFYNVYNQLGYGFLEKVYENAMLIELKKMALDVKSQQKIKVYYDNIIVGDYIADIIVNDSVVIELKSVKYLLKVHEVQLVNYLKATRINVGLLLNFGEKPEIKRKYFTN